jgi:two-component system, OmpR family, sensor histidine kinase CpxA
MRGIALKIFLSFWLIFAVLIASFAVLPNRVSAIRLADRVRLNGLVASALLERGGAQACSEFSDAVAQRTNMQFALFDSRGTAVCRAPGADLSVFERRIAASPGQRPSEESSATLAFASVESPSGAPFIAAGAALPGRDAPWPRPPFPYGPVGLAILVSGVVCFSVARYLARPLQHVRDVSYRLAAGDLQARVGPQVAARRDEIGDLVRDFDAMASRIEALVHSQRQLLTDISHELRSPLARLNVALELARRKGGQEAGDDLNRIEAEVDRMNELIGRVLALARAEGKEDFGAGETIDVAELVRQVADDAEYEARRQNKSVAFQVVASPVVHGDPQFIASAVDNIIRNAVCYTPETSSVQVVVDATNREAIVSVRDQGPGVPAPELERIFSPFHRIESARTRDAGGVGLGLAIARRAIAVHGGSLRAENAPGGGLLVTIRIPLEAAPETR